MKGNYLARINKITEQEQTLSAHLGESAALAKSFAAKAGLGLAGELLGLAHDLGKYADEFQQKLHGANIKYDHAAFGAQTLARFETCFSNSSQKEHLSAALQMLALTVKAQYDKLCAEYKTLEKSTGFMAKRKAEKARIAANEYYETHRREITLCQNAEQYLKDALQKHYDPKKLPQNIKTWKAEQAELLSKKAVLNGEYKKLKEEVREVEIIRREVEQIIRAERPKQQTREQGMEI